MGWLVEFLDNIVVGSGAAQSRSRAEAGQFVWRPPLRNLIFVVFLCAAVGVGGLTVGNDLRACGLLLVAVFVAAVVAVVAFAVTVGGVGYGGRLTVAFISVAAAFLGSFPRRCRYIHTYIHSPGRYNINVFIYVCISMYVHKVGQVVGSWVALAAAWAAQLKLRLG